MTYTKNTGRSYTQQVVNENNHAKRVLASSCSMGVREAQSKNAFRAPLRSGFALCPSSSRSVSMRDIGAAHTYRPQLQACGVTKCVVRGFTLIELLVVVLIIGILAAVALPQYQKAVEKSRVVNSLMALKTVAQAENAYYLSHGKYARDLSELDITMPSLKDNWRISFGAWYNNDIPQEGSERIVASNYSKYSDAYLTYYFNTQRIYCVLEDSESESGRKLCQLFPAQRRDCSEVNETLMSVFECYELN